MTEGSCVRGSKPGCAVTRSSHRRMNLATLLLLMSWGVGGGVAMPRGLVPPPQFQDPASLPILDEVAIAEIREHMANAEPQTDNQRVALLYQLIKQYMAETGAAGEARMAIPPPLLHSAAGGSRAHPGQEMAGAALVARGGGGGEEGVDEEVMEEENKPKRVSAAYMSLCHFKICNMGRKRNYRYTPWVRV